MELSFGDVRIGGNLLIQTGVLQIPKNRLSVITGANGVGKTLLLKRIFENCFDWAVLVPQENDCILSGISVLENISMTENRKKNASVTRFLKVNGMSGLLSLNPDSLSGGEKRTVSILRGMFSDKPLIIMDEPTNDLDHSTVEILLRLFRDPKKTFLVVTHDDRVISSCDTLTVVHENRLSRIRNLCGSDPANAVQDSFTPMDSGMRRVIGKAFSPNRFTSLTALCMCLISFLLLEDFSGSFTEAIPLMESRQIEIFSPLSDSAYLTDGGAYPISVLTVINEDISIYNVSEIVRLKISEKMISYAVK